MLRKLIHVVILCAPAHMPSQVYTHKYMKHTIYELVEQFVVYSSTMYIQGNTLVCAIQ